MTTIAILSDDFEILFEDETTGTAGTNAGLRLVRRATGASDTVYTTNQLYSAIAEVTDDFIAMGFRNPMLPVTPNAYTMENDFFIPRSSCEFLKEGAITANWALKNPEAGDTDGHGVIKVEYSVGGGSNFVSGDIGRQVTDATDEGTLLDFDIDQNGTLIVWIRPNDSTPVTGDLFDAGSGTLEVTTDGGVGTVTIDSVGVSGTTQYSAIQAIGSVPSATEVYLIQDRIKLSDADTNTFQWWDTNATVSLGIISVLIKVIDSGVTIAGGDLEVFARRYTALYDNFRLNVIGGGFSALPLAAGPDINNTTGYRTTGTLTGVGGTWTVGNGVYQGATWATATARGVVTDTNGNTDLEYYIVGDLTDLASTTAIKEYDFTAAADGDATATTATVASNSGGPTDSGAGEGGTVTITLGAVEVDHDGDSVNEPYSVQVDAQGPGGNGVTASKVYERLKYVTRRGGNATDLFGASVNVPGETYRGADGVYEVDSVAAFTEGEDVDIVAQADYGSRSLSNHDGRSPPHVVLTDQQTSLDLVIDNSALRDEGTDTVTVEDGAGATLFFAGAGGGIQTFTSPKASPLGTFTGTVLFGARCINFTGFHDDDTQNYILTDDLGTLRTPPNTVTFTVNNTVAGDHVLVARDTGVDGVIDKDQFGGMTAVAASSKTITVAGTIDTEAPTAGWVRVVENTLLEEHRYQYASRVAGASGVFSLTDITAAAATGGTSSTKLFKTGGPSFVTEGVEPGMLVQDTTNTGTYEVTIVDGADELTIVHLYGADLLASGDSYNINETIQLYATGDDLFDLILDVLADATSESNTFVQSTAFDVVVNVRNGKTILPFTTNVPVGAAGGSATVVRTPDTIAV